MRPLSDLQLLVQNLIAQASDPSVEAYSELTRDTPKFTNEERWGIYRYAIPARIAEAVTKDFAILNNIIGREKLLQIASDYIRDSNFEIRTFEGYAEGFANFISKSKWKDEFPWASEFADFEFALYYLSHADSGTSKLQEKQSLFELISPDKLQFVLASMTKLRKYRFDVLGAYETETAPKPQETLVAIFSTNSEAKYLEVEEHEYEALNIIQSGASLFDLLNFFESNEIQAETVSHYFNRWSQNGIISDVRVLE